MSVQETAAPSAPDHVPPDLVAPEPVTFNDTAACPYAKLSALHAGPRTIFTPASPGMRQPQGSWILTKAEDIRTTLQQPEIFSSKGIAGFSRLVGESWDLIPLELDPPDHAKFRAVMNGIFAPKKIAAMEDGVRERAVRLIEAVKDTDGCEFMETFGRPFPIAIFMQLMGLPEKDFDSFVAWEHGLLHSGDMTTRMAAAKGIYDYLRALIAERRETPADDLTTFAIQATVDGRPTSDDEIMGICYLLVVAGLDTVASALGLHFRHLAQNPEDQARLRADPSLIPAAIEEFLRRYSTVTTSRFVTQDTEAGGVAMKAGDRVSCSTILASLDPTEFDHPMDVDIERSPNRHVAFSYGPHRCIGSHLARRELVIAMEEWLRRVPPFRVTGGVEVPVKPSGVWGVETLPLTWA